MTGEIADTDLNHSPERACWWGRPLWSPRLSHCPPLSALVKLCPLCAPGTGRPQGSPLHILTSALTLSEGPTLYSIAFNCRLAPSLLRFTARRQGELRVAPSSDLLVVAAFSLSVQFERTVNEGGNHDLDRSLAHLDRLSW